jgi:hypothetical protein
MAIGTGTAILGSAVIGAGASYFGSRAQANAAGQAQDFLGDESELQRKEQQKAIKRLEPFRSAGQEALARLYATTKGDAAGFTETPGYQFRLAEGIKAIDRSAAAKGVLFSGRQVKDVQRYGEGLASNEFANFQNRLYDISGLGLSAGSAQSGIQPNINTGGANAILAGGDAAAGAYAGVAGAVNKGVENAFYAKMIEEAYRRRPPYETGGYYAG